MFDYLARTKQLLREMARQMAACIVSSMPNIRYYSGFTGDSGVLLMGGEERMLFTDSRYREQAKEQAPDYQYHEFDSASSMWTDIAQVCADKSWKTLGFEEETILFATQKAMTAAIEAQWVGVSNAMNRQRSRKDARELEHMRTAACITDAAFTHILSYIKPGVTEIDIALELEFFMRKNGADGISFDPIVASGTNGSRPHAIPTAKKIENGELLTMDFGCISHGYCSDMTRTIGVGELAEKQVSVYNIVLEAQRAASEQARVGMTGKQIDAIARDYIAQAGYGAHFGHGLGHSLGLEIHENPRFSRFDDTVIEAGMVMTIEPGIYLDGQFGIRIEDCGLMGEDGFETFEHSPRELIYV